MSKNGFKIKSINEDYYGTFLSYKIETILLDPEDVSFYFNALFPRFDSMEKLKLDIPEGKWGYINDEEKGKGKILHTMGFNYQKKREFSEIVFKKSVVIIYTVLTEMILATCCLMYALN